MGAVAAPELHWRHEDGQQLPLLLWRFDPPRWTVSSAVLGGGLGPRHWVINASVPPAYSRMDPEAHLAELADGLGLRGPGAGLLTAVDVSQAVTVTDGGVTVTATTGLGHPAWAAAPDGHLRDQTSDHLPGTINIVALVPVAFTGAAMVNAVATLTEAKAQALWTCGVAATGTASDAICLAAPARDADHDEERYGGPRSTWGAPLARACYEAVERGSRAWLARADRSGGG
jgi:adenosylcobinamide amidohydrolase